MPLALVVAIVAAVAGIAMVIVGGTLMSSRGGASEERGLIGILLFIPGIWIGAIGIAFVVILGVPLLAG